MSQPSEEPLFMTEADVIDAIGQQMYQELFRDRTHEPIDIQTVNRKLMVAEREAMSFGLSNWKSIEQFADVCRADVLARHKCAMIAAEIQCWNKPGFTSADGTGRYREAYKEAKAYFKELSQSQRRSVGEQSAGEGVNVAGYVKPKVAGQVPRPIFGPNPATGSKPGRF